MAEQVAFGSDANSQIIDPNTNCITGVVRNMMIHSKKRKRWRSMQLSAVFKPQMFCFVISIMKPVQYRQIKIRISCTQQEYPMFRKYGFMKPGDLVKIKNQHFYKNVPQTWEVKMADVKHLIATSDPLDIIGLHETHSHIPNGFEVKHNSYSNLDDNDSNKEKLVDEYLSFPRSVDYHAYYSANNNRMRDVWMQIAWTSNHMEFDKNFDAKAYVHNYNSQNKPRIAVKQEPQTENHNSDDLTQLTENNNNNNNNNNIVLLTMSSVDSVQKQPIPIELDLTIDDNEIQQSTQNNDNVDRIIDNERSNNDENDNNNNERGLLSLKLTDNSTQFTVSMPTEEDTENKENVEELENSSKCVSQIESDGIHENDNDDLQNESLLSPIHPIQPNSYENESEFDEIEMKNSVQEISDDASQDDDFDYTQFIDDDRLLIMETLALMYDPKYDQYGAYHCKEFDNFKKRKNLEEMNGDQSEPSSKKRRLDWDHVFD